VNPTQIVKIDTDEFSIRWCIEEDLATAVVTEILYRDDRGRIWFRTKYGPLYETNDINRAETLLTARVKWDGFADWDFGRHYTFGARDLETYFELLKYVFKNGVSYMGCENESPWPEEVKLG